jgi:hypothetical protein
MNKKLAQNLKKKEKEKRKKIAAVYPEKKKKPGKVSLCSRREKKRLGIKEETLTGCDRKQRKSVRAPSPPSPREVRLSGRERRREEDGWRIKDVVFFFLLGAQGKKKVISFFR